MPEPGMPPIPGEITEFLGCATPPAWLDAAVGNEALLLLDHANCEKKAAATALSLMFRYADCDALVYRMSRLAREELKHFEQVQAVMQRRGIRSRHVGPSRYAAGLRRAVRRNEPERLVDLLISGAFIEARSCERFAALLPRLDEPLADFYRGLLASEARHFKHYLALAEEAAGEPAHIEKRVSVFRAVEENLISTPDSEFRFHSGPPQKSGKREAGSGKLR